MTEALVPDGFRRVPTPADAWALDPFPQDMREWAKWECAPDLSAPQVLALLVDKFPAPWPNERTVRQWREAGRNEQSETRRAVWERAFSDSARYLVPKVIVSLDRALTSMVDLLAESRGEKAVIGRDGEQVFHKDSKAAVAAAGKIKEIGGELLSHLGAPTLEPTPVDPASIRLQFIAARISAGKSQAEAEADFADMVVAVSPQGALGGGQG